MHYYERYDAHAKAREKVRPLSELLQRSLCEDDFAHYKVVRASSARRYSMGPCPVLTRVPICPCALRGSAGQAGSCQGVPRLA